MSEQPVGTVGQEDLEQFSELQQAERELYVTIGRLVVEAVSYASQTVQVKLQQQRVGEKIREDLGIPPESHIRMAASGEVFVVEDD